MNSTTRLFLAALVTGVFSFGLNPGHALSQQALQTAGAEKVTHLGTYLYSEKKFVQQTKSHRQQETIFDNTNQTGGFLPPNQVGKTPPVEFLDWGQTNGGTIEGFQIGYATPLTGQLSLQVKFYHGTNNTTNGTEIASFDLTGLAGSTSGQVETFTLDVDISATPFVLPPGYFGYGYVVNGPDTGPLTADGGLGSANFYRLPPSLINLTIAGFFAQFHMKLIGAILPIIFVNNSGANGDGSFLNPYDNLASAETASKPGDIISLMTGSGPYDVGITLQEGQKLIGQGVPLFLGETIPIEILPEHDAPVISVLTGTAAVLHSGTEIAGLVLEGTTTAILVEATDDVAVSKVDLLFNGTAIHFNGANGKSTFSDVKIKDPLDTGILITGGSGDIEFTNGQITQNQNIGRAIFVNNHTTGTFTYNGDINFVGDTNPPSVDLQFDEADGDYDFKGDITLSGGKTGIGINNSNGTFNFGSTRISDMDSTGVSVRNSNANVMFKQLEIDRVRTGIYGEGGTFTTFRDSTGRPFIKATGGPALFFKNCQIDLNFGSLSSTNSHDYGLSFMNVTGKFTVLDSTIVRGSGSHGFNITNTSGAFNFGSTSISNTDSVAVRIRNSSADVTFKRLDIDSARVGVQIDSLAGKFAITGDGTPGSGGLMENAGAGFSQARDVDEIKIRELRVNSNNFVVDSFFDITYSLDFGSSTVNIGDGGPNTTNSTTNSLSKNSASQTRIVLSNSSFTGAGGVNIRVGGTAATDIELTGNTITTTADSGLTVQTSDSSTAFVTLANNDVSAAINDFVLAQDSSSTFQLAGFAGGDAAAITAFIQDNNAGTPTVTISGSISADPTTSVEESDPTVVPSAFHLAPNYPNPFNPSTTIQFDLPRQSEVTLSIYNLSGQLVRTLVAEKFTAGNHSVVWDGRDERARQVTSGLYVTRMQAGDFVQHHKMLLIK